MWKLLYLFTCVAVAVPVHGAPCSTAALRVRPVNTNENALASWLRGEAARTIMREHAV